MRQPRWPSVVLKRHRCYEHNRMATENCFNAIESVVADKNVPTLFEWLGGMPALDRLMSRFYERVKDDPILAPIFANMGGDHPHHVAVFLAEVLGGPTGYSERFGGHPRMIQRHLNRHLTQPQRRQWVRSEERRVGKECRSRWWAYH